MIDLDNFIALLLPHQLQVLTLCPHNSRHHGRIIQDVYLQENNHWNKEVPFMVNDQVGQRFDLNYSVDRGEKIIEVSSLRADQIAKNFISRMDWIQGKLGSGELDLVEFVILCYDSENQENRNIAIAYLRKCLRLVKHMDQRLIFEVYYVENGTFLKLELLNMVHT